MTSPESAARQRISAAKLWLTAPNGGDAPYLSTALYACTVVLSEEVAELAADDRWRIYANPGFVAAAEVPALGGHLAHVLWHLLMSHAERARSMGVGRAESHAWTTASDLCVAEALHGSGHDRAGLPLPAERGLRRGLAAEEYFALINRLSTSSGGEEDEDCSCGSCADGVPRGYELPSGDGSLDQVRAAELRKLVAISFKDHVQTRGTVAGDWGRWITDILEPKVPWQQVLRSSVRRAVAWTQGNVDPTYLKPSRRQAASPRAILPGTRHPVPAVAIVIDTSGSMDDGLVAQALGEVDGVLKSLGGAIGGVDVLSCDAEVGAVSRVTSAKRVELVGGGGTDMREGIKAALCLRPRPEVIIVLTDGHTPWPATALRTCAVVAVLLNRGSGPLPPSWITQIEVAS